MAAGVQLKSADGKPMELVPILIDTDATNRDTLSCVSLLEQYETIHKQCSRKTEGGFFFTSIRRLGSFSQAEGGGISKTFRSDFQSVQHTTFGNFIAFDQIADLPTRYMLQTLYSKENFNEELTGGFLGNPNVGAAVLAAFKDAPDFHLFAKEFTTGDRIFVINSIFGGTGAAGLPWLLKWLRSDQQVHGSAESIRHAVIGALTVLPYFKVKDEETSRINSSSFITKTKAALSYYHGHIKNLNALYYIADTVQATYANHESGEKQQNPAHLVELLGAIAMVEFAALRNEDCTPVGERYYEFGLNEDVEHVTLPSLGQEIEQKIGEPLCQMQMLSLMDSAHFPAAGHQTWAKENGLTRDYFLSQGYRQGIGKYIENYYRPWIEEMDQNRRAFSPFNLNTLAADMTKLLKGRQQPSRSFFKMKVGAEMFDREANKLKGDLSGQPGTGSRFLDVCWLATRQMTKSLLK
jgi:hypothetical protein